MAHHGIYCYGGDNLFTRFDYGMQVIHDITVSESAGNVIAAGKGIDLTFDHHARAPYENLSGPILTPVKARDCGPRVAVERLAGIAARARRSGTFAPSARRCW